MPRFERVVFFGTPDIALPTLEALVESGRAPILVVTRPGRPAGRGQRERQPPVALRAAALGLRVAQPERVRDAAFLDGLRALRPDVAVVVAFGQIFPPALLETPRHGCVNVHFSLLPKYRGAAPVPAAIAAGETVTGVTTMWMEAGLDTGPILLARQTPIGPDETAGEVAARLARLGAALLVETLAGLEVGGLTAEPQDDARASYAPKLERAAARADWSLPAPRLHDLGRALAPRPGLDAELAGAPLKIWRTRIASPAAAAAEDGPPGELLAFAAGTGGGWLVRCSQRTVLEILEVQRPGRRRVSAAEFARGERLHTGVVLR